MIAHRPRTTTPLALCFVLLLAFPSVAAQKSATKSRGRSSARAGAVKTPASESPLCSACIRAELEFLASDVMHGRGSGTHDEELAAAYIGSELRRFGIEPSGDNGSYIQMATMTSRSAAAPPVLTFTVNGSETRWTHGQQFIALSLSAANVAGPLQKIASTDALAQIKPGAIVLAPAGFSPQNAGSAMQRGAAAVLIPASARATANWEQFGKRLPVIGADASGSTSTTLLLNDAAQKALAALPDGTEIKLQAEAGPEQMQHTWNALGILRGSVPGEAVLLSAHLDHLGVRPPGVNGDDIYNGADDDASGCVAALQLARALGAGGKPRRSVVFAFFGSEERGGYGARWFLAHPPVPLENLVANLEFEMIGRADAAVKPDELWLTGWERSNLGPTLAQHGAKLVQDPHPAENFFQRSDNITLARRGVVAQTVSSFGLHRQYHQPDDDLAHIDFTHMDQAIGSMIEPVRWLVNSEFKPEWVAGKKP